MYDMIAITARVEHLDAVLECSGDAIFNQVATEFGIAEADAIASAMGCRCPYGLIGWLEADQEEDPELEALLAETRRLLGQ